MRAVGLCHIHHNIPCTVMYFTYKSRLGSELHHGTGRIFFPQIIGKAAAANTGGKYAVLTSEISSKNGSENLKPINCFGHQLSQDHWNNICCSNSNT